MGGEVYRDIPRGLRGFGGTWRVSSTLCKADHTPVSAGPSRSLLPLRRGSIYLIQKKKTIDTHRHAVNPSRRSLPSSE